MNRTSPVAIAEAVARPAMRFVALKRPDQIDLQALHRIRDQLVGARTRPICQVRGVADALKLDLPRVLADESNDLTPTMRRLLADLFSMGHLESAERTLRTQGSCFRLTPLGR